MHIALRSLTFVAVSLLTAGCVGPGGASHNEDDSMLHLDLRSRRIIAIGAIDNLVKGAAGQAVQAFDIASGLAETSGLDQLPLYP